MGLKMYKTGKWREMGVNVNVTLAHVLCGWSVFKDVKRDCVCFLIQKRSHICYFLKIFAEIMATSEVVIERVRASFNFPPVGSSRR